MKRLCRGQPEPFHLPLMLIPPSPLRSALPPEASSFCSLLLLCWCSYSFCCPYSCHSCSTYYVMTLLSLPSVFLFILAASIPAQPFILNPPSGCVALGGVLVFTRTPIVFRPAFPSCPFLLSFMYCLCFPFLHCPSLIYIASPSPTSHLVLHHQQVSGVDMLTNSHSSDVPNNKVKIPCKD